MLVADGNLAIDFDDRLHTRLFASNRAITGHDASEALWGKGGDLTAFRFTGAESNPSGIRSMVMAALTWSGGTRTLHQGKRISCADIQAQARRRSYGLGQAWVKIRRWKRAPVLAKTM